MAELHVFSGHISLDSTLPMSHADALAHKAESVQGSVLVNRDLNELVDKLDINGAAEFKREVALHGHIPMRDCTSWRHEGRRDLPASAFRGEVTVCIRCEMAKAAHLAKRQHKDASKPTSWRKAFQMKRAP